MEKSVLEELQIIIIEQMAAFYSRNEKYNQSISKENELIEKLMQNLTVEQMELVEEFYSAICSTIAVCELLAYRQGMRDMVSILSGK